MNPTSTSNAAHTSRVDVLRDNLSAAAAAHRAQRRALRHQVRSSIPSSDLEAEQLLTPSIDPRHEWFFLALVITTVAMVLLTVMVSA